MTVDDIMRERNVGKKRAYTILKQSREAEMLDGSIPNNQRERVLWTLFRGVGDIRNTNDLIEALHKDNYAVDGHDATKVLWSLQKTGHVKFRERQNPKFLYAIRLTSLGWSDAEEIGRRRLPELVDEIVETKVAIAALDAEVVEESVVIHDTQDPDDPESVAFGSDPYAGQPIYAGPSEPGRGFRMLFRLDTGGYPAIRDVRDRARKAKRLAAAAAILEEVGEDDMAIELMNKTDFSDLEREVIAVLERMEEI